MPTFQHVKAAISRQSYSNSGLTQDDSGGHRTTRVGEEPNVVLAENPTTGYRWHSEIDARTLQQTGDHYEGSAGPRGGSRHPSADLQGSPSRPGAPAG